MALNTIVQTMFIATYPPKRKILVYGIYVAQRVCSNRFSYKNVICLNSSGGDLELVADPPFLQI